jgi:hypothetical protein
MVLAGHRDHYPRAADPRVEAAARTLMIVAQIERSPSARQTAMR